MLGELLLLLLLLPLRAVDPCRLLLRLELLVWLLLRRRRDGRGEVWG